jgi:Flp pilus assembly CpaE family ATPase
MREPLRVLVVGADPGLADQARQCVSGTQPPVAVQWLRDAAMALARAGGGDIDALVVDPAAVGAGGEALKDWLERLRQSSKRTQAIVVSGSRNWTADLRRMAANGPLDPELSDARPSPRPARKAKWIGFFGAKGGVGATTVALNVAFALAEKRAAILAELGSGNDSLTLRVRTTARAISPPGAVLGPLWSVKGVPGLRIALAQEICAPDAVAGELESMGAEADYLVLDLGATLTPAVKCVLPRLDALGVVVDMDMLSVECARRILGALDAPDLCPLGCIGLVVVNRASLACPVSVDEMRRLTGKPVLGSIPPAADLSSAAQKARRPIVAFEPESLAAQSLVQVAFAFAELT